MERKRVIYAVAEWEKFDSMLSDFIDGESAMADLLARNPESRANFDIAAPSLGSVSRRLRSLAAVFDRLERIARHERAE